MIHEYICDVVLCCQWAWRRVANCSAYDSIAAMAYKLQRHCCCNIL